MQRLMSPITETYNQLGTLQNIDRNTIIVNPTTEVNMFDPEIVSRMMANGGRR